MSSEAKEKSRTGRLATALIVIAGLFLAILKLWPIWYPANEAGVREAITAGNNHIGNGARYARKKFSGITNAKYDPNNQAATRDAGLAVALNIADDRDTANAWKYGSMGLLHHKNETRTEPGRPQWQNRIPLTKAAPIEIYDVSGTVEAEGCSGFVSSGPAGTQRPHCISHWPLADWLLADADRHLAHVGRICEGEGCSQRLGGTVFLISEGVRICAEGDPKKPGVVVVGRTGSIQTGINDHPLNYELHKSGDGFKGYPFSFRFVPPEACF